MIRRRSAAAADDVDEAAGDERLQQLARLVGLLVVLPERVRQPGVRVAEHVALGEPRELFEVRAHLARAERAVHADGQRPGVTDRGVERVDHLARQRAAAEIGDRHRDEDRQAHALLLEHVLDRDDAGLGVERVEDRLEQQEIGAAVDEAARLILVGGARLVEGHPAERRIVDLGRDRQRPVHRTKGAGHESRPVGRLRVPLVDRLARQARAFDVQLVGKRLEGVVGLRDGGAREGVRLDDVGAGGQILAVNGADDVRPRQDEDVAVPAQVLGVVLEALAAEVGLGQLVALDHRAHRAVEEEHALLERAAQRLLGGGTLFAGDY